MTTTITDDINDVYITESDTNVTVKVRTKVTTNVTVKVTKKVRIFLPHRCQR